MGRDNTKIAAISQMKNFNSHARVGRDEISERLGVEVRNFNSHARVGRDTARIFPPVI